MTDILIWKNGDVGIALDKEQNSITLFAGNASIHLDGEQLKTVIQGSLVENHGGEKLEDLVLKKPAGIETLIPSTITTPQPQSTLQLPVQYVGGLLSDTFNMITNLIGG